jgi:schlafen family protein
VSIFSKPIESVTEQTLQELVTNRLPENKTLEYKSALPDNTHDAKVKFLAAASSFANTSGGDLVIGIREENREPVEVNGLGTGSVDLEKQRLEALLRDGVEPRIPGVVLREVSLAKGGHAIIVRVPRSWASPHRVTLGGHSHFYGRNSSGKYQLDVHELRTAFARGQEVAERARLWRLDRLARIEAGETQVPLEDGPRVVLHVIPMAAFDPGFVPELPKEAGNPNLFPLYSMGCSGRPNFDGFLTFYSPKPNPPRYTSYLQVFRNGAIETVDVLMLSGSRMPSGLGVARSIPSVALEVRVIEALQRYVRLEREIGVEPPVFVALTLLGAKGYAVYVPPERMTLAPVPIDRDALVIPAALVEDFGTTPDVMLKPVFDAVWNAAGYPESIHYRDGRRVD